MARRKKHQTGKSATNKVARKMPLWWLLITVMLAGLALLVIFPNPLKHGPREGVQAKPDSQSATAAANAALGPPTGSENTATTNDLDLTDVDKAADRLNRGTELLAQAKIDEAVAQYKEALKLNPEDEDTHYNLALALAKQGDRQGAKEQYLEALRIYPDYAEAHNNLGNLLVSEGNLDEAIAHFRAALKIAGDSPSARNNLGNALARQGKTTEAVSCFREAIRLKPDYLEARHNLGSVYLTQNRIDEAIAEFTEILRLRPDFAPARRALLKARQRQAK